MGLEPSAHRHPTLGQRRRRFAAFMAIAALGATFARGALASDVGSASPSMPGGSFSSGTIVLGLSPSSALLAASDLMPGSVVSGTLVVSNVGTGALRYAMRSSSTNPDGKNLRDQLTLAIRTVGTGCEEFDGALLYDGALSSAVFGSSAVGQQPGDRSLAAGASETLCFRATPPSGTGNSYQGATTTATFTFDAEEVAGN